MRTRIKICGLTREADVAAAVSAGADAVGFVCNPKSPRYIAPVRLRSLARHLPPFATPVLLFVNAAADLIEDALAAAPDALLQFHGDEHEPACSRYGRPYLRAIRMDPEVDLLDCERILVFWIGVYPNSYLCFLHVSVQHLLERVNAGGGTQELQIAKTILEVIR